MILLIGAGGTHGRKLAGALKDLGLAFKTAGRDWRRSLASDSYNWVLIASPDLYHYEQALCAIESGCNVFLEKPPTLTKESLISLYDAAEENSVKLYVDDVFLYSKIVETTIAKHGGSRELEFYWAKSNNNGSTACLLHRLGYHHFYILRRILGKSAMGFAESKCTKYDADEIILEARLSCDLTCKFHYSLNSDQTINTLNGSSLTSSSENPMLAMLRAVFSENLDLSENKKNSIFAVGCIESFRERHAHRINVIGAGLFGLTSALELAHRGHHVTVYEERQEILMGASGANQWRVHMGYHYPRSTETVHECLSALPSFEAQYGDSFLSKDGVSNYYAISSSGSKVSPDAFAKFMEVNGLPYSEGINISGTSLVVEVPENLIDPERLRELLRLRGFASGLDFKFGVRVEKKDLRADQKYVVATYANLNYFAATPRRYQYEVVEKPVFKLPERYSNLSLVVMDGPFFCMDPFGETGLHLMGNVEQAIHASNVGYEPHIPDHLKSYINAGLIRDPSTSYNTRFIEFATTYLPDLAESTWMGSFYTIRVVLADRDFDDGRPSEIIKLSENCLGIFSGKLCHCVRIARDLAERI